MGGDGEGMDWEFGIMRCELLYEVLVTQLYPALCDPMNYSLPGMNTGVRYHSLLQGIFLTRDQTQVSHIAGRFFTIWATREAPNIPQSREMQAPAFQAQGQQRPLGARNGTELMVNKKLKEAGP